MSQPRLSNTPTHHRGRRFSFLYSPTSRFRAHRRLSPDPRTTVRRPTSGSETHRRLRVATTPGDPHELATALTDAFGQQPDSIQVKRTVTNREVFRAAVRAIASNSRSWSTFLQYEPTLAELLGDYDPSATHGAHAEGRVGHEESHPRGTTDGGAVRVQDSQHDDPSRDARQLPSGVTLSRGTGEPALSSEPCNNAHLRTRFREPRRASEKTKACQFLPVGTPVPGRWLCPRTSAGAKAGGWRSWTSFPMAGPAPCADYPKKV